MVKKFLRSPIATAALSVLAIGMILFGGIHTIQAAPRVISDYYGAQVKLSEIKTALVENGTAVDDGAALLSSLADVKVQPGNRYDETLAVRNTGDIAEYVRVTVYTYWTDADGNAIKATDLDPSYIRLNFDECPGWTIDTDASTPERTVLYYGDYIEPGDTTDPFVTKLAISSEVSTAISGDGAFEYEGVTFHVKAVADAVQQHNGDKAMTSAWGRTN